MNQENMVLSDEKNPTLITDKQTTVQEGKFVLDLNSNSYKISVSEKCFFSIVIFVFFCFLWMNEGAANMNGKKMGLDNQTNRRELSVITQNLGALPFKKRAISQYFSSIN